MENCKFNGIVIAGPTGVGKTELSIKLAKILNTEIISADSSQVFKGLDIGTAKITKEEADEVPHHLIDICDPIKKYSVGDFQKDADAVINRLVSENKIPIVAGGTGLYISSVTEGLSDMPLADNSLRESFNKFSTVELYAQLVEKDPEAAENIHENNRVKIERALEVCILSGNKFSQLSKNNLKNNTVKFLCIALERDRELLYQRINKRVDIMMESGLLKEVTALYEKYGENLKNLNIIGYSEIIDHLKGNCTLEEAISMIKQNSRRYAKRQFTWFRNRGEYIWYNLDNFTQDEIIDEILKKIK